MRIAMIGAKGIPVETGMGGGVERVLEELTPRLVKAGHEVTVYARPYANPSRRKTWEGVRIITLPCPQVQYIETISHVLLSTFHALFQGYDIIHYHSVGPSTAAWIPRLFAWGSKVVVTFHARDQFHELRHPFARLYLAFGEWTAVRFPHATIAVSHVIRTFCREKLHANVAYIPNGVNIPSQIAFQTSEVKGLDLEPGRYLLGVGRLVQFKAFDIALDAFRDVDTDMPFVIAGSPGYDTAYAKKLERTAARDPRVRLIGFQSGKTLQQLIAHAYVVVHPSRIEGMSLSILEAMSYGKLVIMSDIEENREIADHAAICVRTDDRDAFKDAINWAIQDPVMVKERGHRAREHVRQHYSWEFVTDETEKLYLRLMEG